MRKLLFKPIAIVWIIAVVLTACRGRNAAVPTDETPIQALPSAETETQPTPTLKSTTVADNPVATTPPTIAPEATADTNLEPTQAPTAALETDWEPQIVYSSPENGQVIGSDQVLTIRFDQAMDQASVEDAFNSPFPGSLEWPNPDTLRFIPDLQLTPAQTYTVRIDNIARGVSGRTLREPLALQFQTSGFLEVAQLVPADGSTDVQTDASITVAFNRPIVPLVGTAQQGELPNPLTFEPPVDGVGKWLGTSLYRFQPELLAGATDYRVTVKDDLVDLAGNSLAEAVSAEFSTVAPEIVNFTLPPDNFRFYRDSNTPIGPSDSISVTFNMPMNRASVEAATIINPAAAPTFRWNESGTVMGVSSADLALGGGYEITIGAAGRSLSGASLPGDTSYPFITFPFPAINYTTTFPKHNQTMDSYGVGWFNNANISFVSPMNWETIEDAVTIEPMPERISYNFYDALSFGLNFQIDYNSSYTITIPATAEDIFGNPLGAPAVLQFDTPGYPPFAGFLQPSGITQFSSSFPTELVVSQRNIGAVGIQVERFIDAVPTETILGVSESSNYYAENFDLSDSTEIMRDIALGGVADEATTVIALNEDDAVENGVYLLTMTVPDETTEEKQRASWQNRRLLVVVADTTLVVKETPEQVHVWATDLASGQPVAGREIRFYRNDVGSQPDIPFALVTTDQNGFATVDKDGQSVWQSWDGNVVAVTGEMGSAEFGLTTIVQNRSVSPYEFRLNTDLRSESPETVFLYTERPIYRPGDTVYFRAWVRGSDNGRFTPTQREQIGVNFQSANYEVSSILQEAAVDANGNVYGEYVIPEDAALGDWSIWLSNSQDYTGVTNATFTVAEFRKPEFTVSVTPEADEGLRGEAVRFTVLAEYLFGGNAANLPLNWSLYARSFTPQEFDPAYNFGLDDFNYNWFGGGFSGDYIDGQSAVLDSNGQFVVEIPAEMLANQDAERNLTLTLEVSVQDESNVYISSSGEMVLYSAETQVGIKTPSRVFDSGSDVTVDLLTLDLNGQPIAATPVEVTYFERTWEVDTTPSFSTGIFWKAVDTEVGRETVTSDASGRASASFQPESSGSYVAIATVTDAAGRSHSSNAIFYIYGNDAAWRFDAIDRKMELSGDKTSYVVGDTAEILVQNPLNGPTEAWLTIERGELIESRLITLPAGGGAVEIPITAQHAPNVFVGITAIKPIDDSSRPWADIRHGLIELLVDPAQLALDISISSDSSGYAPGDTVTYQIEATDYTGTGVSAEIGLALVDLAILTLKEDTTPTLLDAFYARVPLRSRLAAGLFNSGEGLAPETPEEPFGGGGGGGGGADAASVNYELAREGEGDVRNDFRDTAFWEALITTDENGLATVTVELPDNLTTWRMTARAVTPDETLVGEAIQEITVSKPLLIRPITPRFFTYGDSVQIGAIVNNNTDSALDATVLLEASGVTFEDSAEQSISIPANDSMLLRWPVFVEDVDEVDMTFRVTAGDLSDATKPTISQGGTIPVYRYDAQDIVGTAGVLDEQDRQVEAILLPPMRNEKRGELTVSFNPSLAASILEARDAFSQDEDFVFDCTYGIAMRLLANAASANAIRTLELAQPEQLAALDAQIRSEIDLLKNRRTGRGWSWCLAGDRDAIEPTVIAVHALQVAGASYDEVGDMNISTVVEWILNSAESIPANRSGADADRAAYYLYVVSLGSELEIESQLDTLLDEGRDLMTPNGLALTQMAYNNRGLQPPVALISDLVSLADVSATGARWETTGDWYLDNDLRTTATVIMALAQSDPENLILPNALRWLMAERGGLDSRYWYTPRDTAWAISAATSYMLNSGVAETDYDYTLRVNGGIVADDSFDSANLTESAQLTVPMADLNTDDLNLLDFRKDGEGSLYYAAWLDAFVSAESVEAVDRGFYVDRVYYVASCEENCQPITSIDAGEEVRVELTIVLPRNRRNVIISDPLPSGADAIDPNLDTSASDVTAGQISAENNPYWWGWWHFERIEFQDEQVVFYADQLSAGTYSYSYNLVPILPGEFQVMPTLAKELARPEVFGRSNGLLFTIK